MFLLNCFLLGSLIVHSSLCRKSRTSWRGIWSNKYLLHCLQTPQVFVMNILMWRCGSRWLKQLITKSGIASRCCVCAHVVLRCFEGSQSSSWWAPTNHPCVCSVRSQGIPRCPGEGQCGNKMAVQIDVWCTWQICCDSPFSRVSVIEYVAVIGGLKCTDKPPHPVNQKNDELRVKLMQCRCLRLGFVSRIAKETA